MSVRSLNKVMLIGNLTRDVELRYTGSGTPVATFGMATNRSWSTGDNGERKEETQFHRIVVWSKLAEICDQLLFKGRKVYIEGRLQVRKWTTQDGQERETAEIVAENMMVLDNRRRDGSQPTSGGGGAAATTTTAAADEWVDVAGGDELISVEEPVEEKKPASKAKAAKKVAKKEKPEEDVVNVDDIPF